MSAVDVRRTNAPLDKDIRISACDEHREEDLDTSSFLSESILGKILLFLAGTTRPDSPTNSVRCQIGRSLVDQ